MSNLGPILVKFSATSIALAVLATNCRASSPEFSVTDLGFGYIPQAVNSAGQVALYLPGRNNASGFGQAYIYSPGKGIQSIGTLGFGAQPNAINSSGQVSGYSQTSNGYNDAFLYTPGAGLADIGSLDGDAIANGLNDDGEVVGYDSGGAFYYTIASGMQRLPDLGWAGTSEAYALNNSGQVVGMSFPISGNVFVQHAVLYSANHQVQDLGTLGGDISYAYGINDGGDITGFAETADGRQHEFEWTPAGGMVEIDSPGITTSFGESINDSGVVVGTAATSITFASYFSAQTGFVDLNNLLNHPIADGGTLTNACGVSNSGMVIATGSDGNAYLLSPMATPGPASCFGFGPGILALLTRQRSRRQKASMMLNVKSAFHERRSFVQNHL